MSKTCSSELAGLASLSCSLGPPNQYSASLHDLTATIAQNYRDPKVSFTSWYKAGKQGHFSSWVNFHINYFMKESPQFALVKCKYARTIYHNSSKKKGGGDKKIILPKTLQFLNYLFPWSSELIHLTSIFFVDIFIMTDYTIS